MPAQIRQVGGQGLVDIVESRRRNERGAARINGVQDKPVDVSAECERGVFQADQKGPLC